jgi:hypothetical protein
MGGVEPPYEKVFGKIGFYKLVQLDYRFIGP